MLEKSLNYNNLNLLRLLAALQVILVHSMNHFEFHGLLASVIKLVPGVPTFFFISGLLIFAAYERSRSNKPSIFFKNRFLRIYPALWVCIIVSTVVVFLTGYLETQPISLSKILIWLFSQSTVAQFYNPDFFRGYGVGVINGALWTISVELQFYILTPLLWWLLAYKKLLFVSVFFVSMSLNIFQQVYFSDLHYLPLKLVRVSFFPWLYMFLVGFLFNKYREKIEYLFKNISASKLFFLYVMSMLSIGSYSVNASNSINPISFFLLTLCIYKLSTVNICNKSNILTYLRRNDFSYGLYLYHMPIINLLIYLDLFTFPGNMFVTIFGAILVAMTSWYLIEKPALNMKG